MLTVNKCLCSLLFDVRYVNPVESVEKHILIVMFFATLFTVAAAAAS
jgi:hypothetical protein